jgi:hypothetical protein
MTYFVTQCAAPGCHGSTSPKRHSPYCARHRRTLDRQGHPQQRPVTLQHLAPYLKRVKARIKGNRESEAWAILQQRWTTIADHAREVLRKRDAGLPFVTYEARAAAALLAVDAAVQPLEVVTVIMAVYLLGAFEPRRFASERSFRFVLVRRVRRLAPAAVGSYWNQKTQRVTAVYREAPPRATECMGNWLADVFAAAGAQLAALERAADEHRANEGKRLADAIGALQ